MHRSTSICFSCYRGRDVLDGLLCVILFCFLFLLRTAVTAESTESGKNASGFRVRAIGSANSRTILWRGQLQVPCFLGAEIPLCQRESGALYPDPIWGLEAWWF